MRSQDRSRLRPPLAVLAVAEAPFAIKVARKAQASKEVGGWLVDAIDTRQASREHPLEMAKRERTRLKPNDSLECRNRHYEWTMDASRQSPRAARTHDEYLITGERTCIDRQKSIADELPYMTRIDPISRVPLGLRGDPGAPRDRLDGDTRHARVRFPTLTERAAAIAAFEAP